MNKKIVRNYMDRVWNEKDAGAIREAFSPSVVLHSPLGSFQGREELEKIFRHWLQAFPDLRVSFEKVFRDDDHVIVHWKAIGTHQGMFKGIAPTGVRVEYSGVTIHRVQENQVVEYWAFVEIKHILEQIHAAKSTTKSYA